MRYMMLMYRDEAWWDAKPERTPCDPPASDRRLVAALQRESSCRRPSLPPTATQCGLRNGKRSRRTGVAETKAARCTPSWRSRPRRCALHRGRAPLLRWAATRSRCGRSGSCPRASVARSALATRRTACVCWEAHGAVQSANPQARGRARPGVGPDHAGAGRRGGPGPAGPRPHRHPLPGATRVRQFPARRGAARGAARAGLRRGAECGLRVSLRGGQPRTPAADGERAGAGPRGRDRRVGFRPPRGQGGHRPVPIVMARPGDPVVQGW